jgi:transmembrane sensor
MELPDFPEGLLERARLIERWLSQDINGEEQAMLDAWLNEAPGNRVFFEHITSREVLLETLAQFYDAKAMTDGAKADVHELIREEQTPIRSIGKRIRYWAVAAAAIIIIATGGYLWYSQKAPTPVAIQDRQQPVPNDAAPGSYKARLTLADGSTIVLDSAAAGKLVQQGNTEVVNKNGGLAYAPGTSAAGELIYNTLTTAKGEIYSLQLSDGSKVWLNSASSVRYPVAFNGSARRVEITGEAYFEVAHLDHNQPFIVMANGMEVKVLGTHFNINAYSDVPQVRTTLLEGRVQITPNGSAKPVILEPGQQAAVSGTKVELIEHADTEQAVAWKNGYFQFSEANLKTVMQEIERWYDVEIVYEGNVPQPVFSGKLSRNANASEVLKVLEQNQVHFRIEGKKIIVTP